MTMTTLLLHRAVVRCQPCSKHRRCQSAELVAATAHSTTHHNEVRGRSRGFSALNFRRDGNVHYLALHPASSLAGECPELTHFSTGGRGRCTVLKQWSMFRVLRVFENSGGARSSKSRQIYFSMFAAQFASFALST